MSFEEDKDEWDRFYMKTALDFAAKSKDPNTKTGAVIVSPNNKIVGVGFNHMPEGAEKISWARQGDFLSTKYAYVVHCELDAILNSVYNLDHCRIYTTLFPCNECAKAIIQKGIKEVIYRSDKYHDEKEWIASRILLRLANVKTRQYE